MGGVDITDDSDIEIEPNTIDAIFCEITDNNQYATISNNGSDPQLSNNNSDIMTGLLQLGGIYRAYAANATVNMYQLWYCVGEGRFDNVNSQSSIAIEVPAFACSASNSAYMGTGTLTATVICRASQGVTSTYNYATACVGGAGCVRDRGIINFRK